MVDDDLELEEDIGEATIVYEGVDETIETTVPNEHIAYFQDHWLIKTDESEEGRDLVRRIPARRVYHVERSVEEFEEEIKTLRDRVESIANELRTKFPGGREPSEQEPVHIGIEEDESSDDVQADEPDES